jgi:uncharacterized protein (DUF2267 family)
MESMMSTNGLEIFDRTIQTTNIWLDEIMAELGPDRHVAWKVLSIVLHKLRDRLSVENAAHLAAQLPLLIRGAYYDQYQPARQPSDLDSIEAFTAEVDAWLSDIRPVDPEAATHAVFGVLLRHVEPGQIAKIQGVLPASIRTFWESIQAERELALADG